MSWLRSLVGKVSGNSAAQSTPGTEDASGPQMSEASARSKLKETSSVNVDKLKGLWALYVNVRSEQERALQLQKFLPLFLSLYEDADFNVITQTFGDTKKLARAVSNRLVKEVRQAWSPNSPREANAKAVLKMLSTAHEDRSGYELLCVLKLICVGALNVEEATSTSIPSTFTSIVELLFSLPVGVADRMPKKGSIETLMELLSYLCTFRYAVVELMKTDTLVPLFALTCSACPPHNAPLRQSAGRVVNTVVRHHIDREMVDYLFVKGFVKQQIDALRANRESIGAVHLVNIWSNMTELLVGSCEFSDSLFEEFHNCEGYDLLLETMLWVETQQEPVSKKSKEPPTPPHHNINKFLVEVVGKLVYVGTKTLAIPESISPYSNPVAAVNLDTQKTVRNFKAFAVLQTYFLQSTDEDCQLRTLDCILSIYMDNTVNFLLLQQQHTLAHFFEEFERLAFRLKKKVLEMLLLVVTVLEYVPFQELSSLSCLLQENPSHDVVEHIHRVVNKLVSFDPLYKKIFQEAGMLVMLVSLMKRYHAFMTAIASGESSQAILEFKSKVYTEQDQPEVVASYTVTMDCIELLLHGVDENIQIFRASGCVQILLSLLYNRDTRPSALQVIKVLVIADKTQEHKDIAGLIEIMQASPRKNFEMKRDILTALCVCFSANEKTKLAFREAGGFICIIRLLAGLEEPSSTETISPEMAEFKKELIGTLFRTITGAIAHHASNRKFFREQIVYTLSGCLKLTGILPTLHAFNVLDSLLCIATETVSSALLDPEKLLVHNPDVLVVIFDLFSETKMEVRIAILQRILQVISIGKRNQEPLCAIGLLDYVETQFETTLQDSSSPLHPLLLKFIVQLAMHRITPAELRKIIRLLQDDGAPMSLLRSLHLMALESTPPYVEFDMMHTSAAAGGFACLHLLTFGDRSWPPANGYTFFCWLYVDVLADSLQQVDVFSFVSDDKRSCTHGYIVDGKFVLSTSAKSQVEFPVDIRPKAWYHLAMTQTRHRFAGGSEVKLYINGELVGSAKSPYVASSSGNVNGYIGTTSSRSQSQGLVWRLGPCYLIEEVLTWEKILTTYCLGPYYATNFQGSFSSYGSYDAVNSRTLRLLQHYDPTETGLGPLNLSATNFSIPEERVIFALSASHVVVDESGSGAVILNAADFSGLSKAVLSGGATALAFSGLPSSLSKIGGVAVIFFLIESASTAEALLCAVELLVVLIRNNSRLATQMERLKGYELLGSFLFAKQKLLSEEILEQIFELCGVAVPKQLLNPHEAPERTPVLANNRAFADIVLNYSIWRWTSIEVQKLYFRGINLLLVNNPQSAFNSGRLRELKLLPKLLRVLQDESLEDVLVDWVGNVINNFVALGFYEEDLRSLSSFLIGTLQHSILVLSRPSASDPRRASVRRRTRTASVKRPSPASPVEGNGETLAARAVLVRNIVLETLVNLLTKTDASATFTKVIRPEWIFLFITKGMDATTVTLGVKMLVLLLQSNTGNFRSRFESANGFSLLEKTLPAFCSSTPLYYLLICALIGKPVVDLPGDISNLQLSYTDLFTTFRPKDFREELRIDCLEMLPVLLKILRKCCAGSAVSELLSYTNVYAESSGMSPVIHSGGSRSRNSPTGGKLTPLRGKQRQKSKKAEDEQLLNVPDGSSSGDGSPEKATTLKRWFISDKDHTIQVAIIEFLSYLFDNCPDLREAFWEDKKGSLIHCVVSTLYPHGYLNFPLRGSTARPRGSSPMPIPDPIEENEDETRCHQSSELLFNFISHVLILASKATPKMMTVFEQVLDSAPWKEVKGAMMDVQAQKKEESSTAPVVDFEYALFQNKLICEYIQFVSKNVTRDVFLENKCLASNIAKLCPFVVDKVTAGLFPNGDVLVFEFLLELLGRLENRNGDSSSISKVPISRYRAEIQLMYKSLNRIIIHLLGASYGKTRDDFVDIIETMLAHGQVAFNPDQEYLSVLCYLLYKFLLDDNRRLRESAQNSWKMLLETHADFMDDILVYKPNKETVVNLKEGGFDLLLKQDYTNFVCWMGDAVQSGVLHKVVHEPLSKAWLVWKEPEKRAKGELLKQQQQRRQAIQEKNLRTAQDLANSMSGLENWRANTMKTVDELNYTHFKSVLQQATDRQRFIEVYWTRLKAQFVRERQLWENAAGSELDRWKLDTTEGPYRMRKKLKRNFKFYEHYPYVQGVEEGAHCTKVPTSAFCKEYNRLHGGRVVDNPEPTVAKKREAPSEARAATATWAISKAPVTPRGGRPASLGGQALNSSLDSLPAAVSVPDVASFGSPASPVPPKILLAIQRSSSFSALSEIDPSAKASHDDDSSDEEEEFSVEEEEQLHSSADEEVYHEDVLNIERLLDYGDKILKMYNCGRVDGMIKRDGVLLICTGHLYMIDDYRVVEGVIEEIPAAERAKASGAEVAGVCGHGEEKGDCSDINGHHSRKWAFVDIRDLFKRRYLLRAVAIELFSNDGRNFLFVFDVKEVDSVFRLVSLKIPRVTARSLEEISGNHIGRLLMGTDDGAATPRLGVVTKLFRRDITHKWTQGQISNFQYLMHLNTLAGRSYNDLTQYPVFPWVLCDYTSAELDLADPAVYRDLSKPMGGVTEARAAEFEQRFEHWDPFENNGVPKWHYGSHYSSAGIVLYYLIRMEPFTQQFLRFLQSGRFDVADRLFHSMQETWNSASGETMNMSDVKELIPEFYYLPDFLCNSNRFDMGVKQSGEEVADVQLPPWAHGDVREFVRLHRAALESEHVSAHLHEWIDLIFGCKQQGASAAEALNVFYYLTYEGSVDIDAIEDPIEKDSVIAQINNFGQTPTRLFKKPHPRRVVLAHSNGRLLDVLTSARSSRARVRDIGEAVGLVLQVGERLVVAGRRRAVLPTRAYNKLVAWGFPDYSLRVLNLETGKASRVLENLHDGQVTAACATEDGRYLITGGADTMLSVLKVSKDSSKRSFRLLRNLCGHLQDITCIAVSRSYSTIVSGSQDGTCIVWNLNKLQFVRQLQMPAEAAEFPISIVVINNITGDIAVVTGPFFHVWSINGDFLFSHRACEGMSITALAITEEADWLGVDYLTGLNDGTIRLWSYAKRDGKMNATMLLQCQRKAHSCAITALHISGDNKRAFSGDESGRVIQWSEDVEG